MNTSTATSPPSAPDRGALLRDRNFLWMMSGGAISMLGDQFTLIALPWLVLKMTGDAAVLGTVILMMGVPRALFLLVGGAFVDRYSPKRVMMATKYVNTLLIGALAAGVLTGTLGLPWLYLLSLGIGLATAFSIPSGSSMLPQVVAPGQLAAANGLMLGMRQLAMFLGPLLAGLLIALFGSNGEGAVADARGLGLAFALDAASFALSAWTLSRVQTRALAPPPRAAVLAAVAEGLRSFWRDRPLRSCLLYWSAVALLITGPVQIALPVLCSELPALGAAAFGSMLAAHGGGTLLGMALAGARPHWRLGSLGLTILAVDALVGLLFMPMGLVTATWQGVLLLLVIGTLGGFMQVAVFSWIQRRVAPAMLGRAMSLFMFIFLGLAPLSSAVTGWLLPWLSLPAVFAGSGALLLAVVALALLGSDLRQVKDAGA